YGRAAVPELTQQAQAHLLELLDGRDRRRRREATAGKLRVLGAPEPLARALDRLDHEQIGHGLVVGEVRGGRGRLVRHCANATQAIGTPASDWRDFSVAEIQLSPSGRSTEAGRTRHRLPSSTLASATPWSRSARAASMSRRRAERNTA